MAVTINTEGSQTGAPFGSERDAMARHVGPNPLAREAVMFAYLADAHALVPVEPPPHPGGPPSLSA